MKKKTSIIILIIATLFVITLNIKVPTKQGVNYEVCVYKIPLYIKIIEFVDRDYRYRRLSQEITKGQKSDKDKVMAIFKWTRANIKTNIPADWNVYDDHILNIIIRGYGGPDQISDVFTILCMYAKLPAGWKRLHVPGYSKTLILSFVKIDGKWRVFDIFRGVYFVNDKGEIASLNDMLLNRYEKDKTPKYIDNTKLTYQDYFNNMEKYMKDVTLRSKKQIPFQRVLHEIINFFNPNKCGQG